jgi:uncharacterized protein with HEPN domain
MPPRDVRMYLFDIRESCDAIAEFVSGLTFDDCKASRLVRSAVERQFEIIGEALRQAMELATSLRDTFPAVRQIIGFRNQLSHGYHMIESDVVWATIQADLPVLRAQVVTLLGPDPPSR